MLAYPAILGVFGVFRSCRRLKGGRAGLTAALLLLLLLLLLPLAMAAPVLAEGKQDARHHYDQATAAFGLGHFLEAAELYQAAFSLRPEPALLYNAAQAYRLGGNKARALELYRNYAHLYGTAPNVTDARQHAADLERELNPVPSPVESPPADAVVPVTAGASSPSSTGSTALTAPPLDAGKTGVPAGPPEQTAPFLPPTDLHLVAAPGDGAAASSPDTPSLVRRPWFWIAIGAVVAAGVLVAVLATSGDKDPKPSIGTITVGN